MLISRDTASACDLIWRQGPYRGHQDKVRSVGGDLIQYDWCAYKKETVGQMCVRGQ